MQNVERITSNQNSHVKRWSKLQTKKGRKESGTYLLEGWHLVSEALKAGIDLVEIMVVDPNDWNPLKSLPTTTMRYEITEEVAKHISSTKTPQGVFATVLVNNESNKIPNNLHGQWLLLDQLQDPGNVGTIVRTADAAGLTGVVLGDGSVDLYNPKVVRSMQGSQFHINLLSGNLLEWLTEFEYQDIPTYGTELNPQAVAYDQVPTGESFGLIMGNEGNGTSSEILAATTKNLYIPMNGKAESLNVAVAAGILMFQLTKK
ncbi:TrmH family RNA methyltransferase [Lentilactobacillus senioris]|uniref:TrmH family RNA methyltransferase n=1 Tax=Lentilactobacillus senioris TaxID=931534 RepID=UPI003D29AB82